MKFFNKYIIFAITITIVTTGTFNSCQKFLQVKQYGPPTSEDFWKTEADAINARNALTMWTAKEGIDGRGHMWFENCSDNMVTGRTQAEGDQIKNFMISANNGRDWRANWPMMYQVIAAANNILINVPGMNISEAVKTNVLAEAHFFRAFSYLWLAPWYADNGPNGGLPIITEKTPIEQMDMARPKSVLENYDMIIEDMRKAGDMLPLYSQVPDAEKGRPHKAAAWALGARAALYAAQYDNKYYSIVLEMTQKVMDLTGTDKRDLYPDYKNLFTEANNFSSEYIYSIQGTAIDGPKFPGMSFQQDGWGIYNTWGFFQPTLDLYESFENTDARRDATILLPGQHIQFVGRDIHYAINPATISSTSGMTFRKWLAPFAAANAIGTSVNPNGNNASTRLSISLIRFADVLLMRAEALIWSQGEGNAEASSLINKVRTRAGLAANSQATKSQLMNERRCELAFEFLPSRHIDLVRWGTAKEIYSKPLFGLRRKFTIGLIGLSGKQLHTLGFTNIDLSKPDNDAQNAKAIQEANSRYISNTPLNISKLSDSDADKKAKENYQRIMSIYEPELEKVNGYSDRPNHIIEGWIKDTIWSSRKFDPIKNGVFPIPAADIAKSENLKQNEGY